MAQLTIGSPTREEWENFLAQHPESNFLQSWSWGEFHSNLGKQISRTGFYKDSQLVGVMLSIVEDAKRGRYLTVPGGPIMDWKNSDHVKTFVEEIKSIGKKFLCAFVRVRPQLLSDEFSINLFQKNGFITAPIHLHAELTSQLDLSPTEDELLANMRKTTRYEIRKGIAEGITVASSRNIEDLQAFYDLQIETSKRQGFVPFSYSFLAEQFKEFASCNTAVLYTATLNKTVLAQAFVIFYGTEAVYHYGASTQEGRRHPGAYLIQWEAIREAKRRGMHRYNFWGIAPEDNPKHRFYGVTVFKKGFGGADVEYLHAQDLVLNPLRYGVNKLVESVRKKMRGV